MFSVLLSLTAQVAMLLSFLLPLKIVMLLGTRKVPEALPSTIRSIEFEPLILALSGITLFFFLVHFLSNKGVEKLSRTNANLILAKSKKLVMFEDQEIIAKTAYKRVVDTSSSTLFSLIGVAILAVLYPDFTLVFLGIITMAFIGVSVCYRNNKTVRNELSKSFSQAIQTPANLCFLALFAYIVIDFLYQAPPNFLVAIATIILSRHVLVQIQVAARNIHGLITQKEKLSAIFLKGHYHNPQPQLPAHSLWHFLSSPGSKQWLSEQLGAELNMPPKSFQISWIDLGIQNCAAFLLEHESARLLIKLFDQNRRSQARHEATLLLSAIEGLPAPHLVSATVLDRFHCHIFDISQIEISDKIDTRKTEYKIMQKLATIEPSDDLVDAYLRSRRTLPNRITTNTLQRLKIAATREEQQQLDLAINKLAYITANLDRLPLNLTISTIGQPKIGITQTGEEVILHWAQWTLEPIGAYWPVTNEEFNFLFNERKTMTKDTAYQEAFTKENLKLSALLSEIERNIEKQKFKSALTYIEEFLETCTQSATTAR